MIEIGRLCIKLAGRDGGRKCVVVDILDNNYVLIDGDVRRRKCNILHLEPMAKKIEIKKGAPHEEVKKQFSKLKLPVWETKKKEKGERPRKIRGKKKRLEEEEKKLEKGKKVKKKEEVKEEGLKEKKESESIKE